MSDLLYYILCGVLTFGVLAGIYLMSKVKTSVWGNLLSAVSMAGAILLTLYRGGIFGVWELWIFSAVGLILGFIGAYRVKMIDMPQAVAILNGFGGAASAIVGAIAVLNNANMHLFGLVTAGLAVAVGAVTLTGSVIAGAKLHNILAQKPITWKAHRLITVLSIVIMAGAVVAFAALPSSLLWIAILVCAVVSGFFGLAFAIRVGGADMPITISLLNSFSGVAGSIAGMAIHDPLLVAVGGVVGASGLLLTQMMCRAMNRKLMEILTGKTSSDSSLAVLEPAAPGDSNDAAEPAQAADPVELLKTAKSVILIPGYGMALAQAQHLVKQLTDALEAGGAQVCFAIHPVAGRMPGHMNVLLAEADVDYEKLLEMDDVNPMFPNCDLAIIIGANDVINPAANTAEGTPIYGMPILNAYQAKHLIICNYDLKPGYAGVENPLYHTAGVVMMVGDAAQTLQQLLAGLQ
jgi:NAD(P) transhydrogenase subunit beta